MTSNASQLPAPKLVPIRGMQQSCIDEVQKLASLRDARIVEIGCDPDMSVGLWLKEHYGVRSLVGINLAAPKVNVSKLPEGITYLQQNACATGLPDGSADVVLGFAVLEHFFDIAGVAREIERLLRPGGAFLLWGGWFWPFSRGTHVRYRGKNGVYYSYNDKKTTLIKPWEHLLFKEPELRSLLAERGLDADDARALAQMVYDPEHLNFLAPSQIESMFRAACKLDIRVEKRKTDDVPPANLQFSAEDLNTQVMIFTGTKPAVVQPTVVQSTGQPQPQRFRKVRKALRNPRKFLSDSRLSPLRWLGRFVRRP